MIDKAMQPTLTADLETVLRERIVHRTNGRVQMLEVERIDNRVVVRGYTMSFHLKQLAIQGLLDVIETDPGSGIELDVHITVIVPAAD